jgi:hypothetical protein
MNRRLKIAGIAVIARHRRDLEEPEASSITEAACKWVLARKNDFRVVVRTGVDADAS